MKYTVIWKPSAEARLIEIWNSADDRAAVRAAADLLDDWLAKRPLDLGESRSPGFRIAFLSPLAIDFRVMEDDRRVEVLRVWRIA